MVDCEMRTYRRIGFDFIVSRLKVQNPKEKIIFIIINAK